MEHWKNKALTDLKEFVKGIGWVTEEWKRVVGYEDYYAVSTFGRVRSYSRLVYRVRFNDYVKRKERILSQKINSRDGYLCVTLQVDKKRYGPGVHILVGKAFIHNDNKDRTQMNHKLGNKKDNRPDQLEWMTAKENSRHAIEIGIDSVVGESNGRCRLTEAQVLEIRSQYKGHKKGYRAPLAKKYGISESQVGKICLRNLWKHI